MNVFKSKRQALFCLAAMVCLSLYLIKDLCVTCVAPQADESYAIEFEWFGMDAEKIERSVAVPLEQKIMALENLICVESVCEYSKCRTSATFKKNKNSARFAVSAAACELSQELDPDAQKPKIYASSQVSIWIFCAAFDAKKHSQAEIEKKLKAKLQSAPGVSQARFGGGQAPEIQLAFCDKRLSKSGLAPWNLSQSAQERNAQALFGGSLAYCQKTDSEQSLNSIAQIHRVAEAKSGFQKRQSIVRVNGAECVLASLKSASESQSIKVSRAARKILKQEFKQKGEYKIVWDNGREQEKMLFRILGAFLQSVLALGAAVAIFYRSAKKAAAILLWTALTLLFVLAAMSATKIPLDSATISGLAICLGLMCDAALYMADDCKTSGSALAVSTLTTICALLPLCALNPLAPGIKSLSLASALSIGISSVLSLLFLPVFLEKPSAAPRKSLNLYGFSYIPPKNILNLSTFLYIFPAIIFVFWPKNLKSPDNSPVIAAQVEYEPERSFESIDQELLPFLREVQKIKGVTFVQSEARRGCAELQIALKSARRKQQICKEIERHGRALTGWLYLPLSPPKRKIVQSVRVSVLGDDNALLRGACKEAAAVLLQKDFVAKRKGQAVLNFKEDEQVLSVKPKKDFLARNGLSAKDFSEALRWNLFGAVIHKIHFGSEAVDVRAGQKDFCFGKGTSLEDFSALQIKGVPLMAACTIQKQKRAEKIFRKGGRRAAHFTVEIESAKSDKIIKEIKRALKDVNLPQGYFFDFPREYQNIRQNYARAAAAFLFALLAIYVLIAGQCERPLDALKALATVPLSLFLPLALRAAFLRPLTLGDAVGMVFVSGLCVNNSLYIMAEFNLNGRKDARAAALAVSKSCLSSAATTVAGALPVLLCGAGGFASDLAFFTLFGTLGSLAASLFVFPVALAARKSNASQKTLVSRVSRNIRACQRARADSGNS